MKQLSLTKKYIIIEAAIAVFEIFFGILSSCLAMSALGLYSLIGVFCVASKEFFPKTKMVYGGFLALAMISALLAWISTYNTHLTIGYANDAVDFWGLIPPIVVFFVKACLTMLYSEESEVSEKSIIFNEIIDYKYDFLLIVSTILAIFLTFVFDFYIEYIVALGIFLCCIRKIILTAKLRKNEDIE